MEDIERVGLQESLGLRVGHRALWKGSTEEDLEVFVESAEGVLDLPTEQSEAERLEEAMETAMTVVRALRKERQAQGEERLRQLKNSRRYGKWQYRGEGNRKAAGKRKQVRARLLGSQAEEEGEVGEGEESGEEAGSGEE